MFRREFVAGASLLVAGCSGSGRRSEEDLKEEFNQHDALRVEYVQRDGSEIEMLYWTPCKGREREENKMQVAVQTFERLVNDGAEIDRMDVIVKDAVFEEVRLEYHVQANWVGEDDILDRVLNTAEFGDLDC